MRYKYAVSWQPESERARLQLGTGEKKIRPDLPEVFRYDTTRVRTEQKILDDLASEPS
jgi:hypothetical protein